MIFEKFFIDPKVELEGIFEDIVKEHNFLIATKEELEAKVRRKEVNPNKTLFITEFSGNFIKDCPCTPKHVSCLYKNINFAYGCPLSCSYCILQHYINYPTLTLFSNMEKIKDEVKEYKKGKKYLRMGTGELTDSLVWEVIYPFSQWFIDVFRKHEDIIFEFKTKFSYIKNFPKLKKNKNIMVSFSLNPKRLKVEEKYASETKSRIKAMGELEERGYIIGVHFDPIIIYDGYEKDYKELIKKLFFNISPNRIGWVSMGALRFFEPLRWIIRESHKDSLLLREELVLGLDKKYRYPFSKRLKAFKTVYSYLRKYGGEDFYIYLCMETSEMWEKVFGKSIDSYEINKNLFFSAYKTTQ